MKSYNVYKNYLWRISGGRYPTFYLLECENENPLKVTKQVSIPVPPKCARTDDVSEYLEEAERIIKSN